jgi:hypothetical protein
LGRPVELITQPTSDRLQFIDANPFGHRLLHPTTNGEVVNTQGWCNHEYFFLFSCLRKFKKKDNLQPQNKVSTTYAQDFPQLRGRQADLQQGEIGGSDGSV